MDLSDLVPFEPATGLNLDYMNAWFHLSLLVDTLVSEAGDPSVLREKIHKPIQTYEQYVRGSALPLYKNAMTKADPQALAALNEQVEQWNALDDAERENLDTVFAYVKRCRNIIEGI